MTDRRMVLAALILAVGAPPVCRDARGPSQMVTVSDSAGVKIFVVLSPPEAPYWDPSPAATIRITGPEDEPIADARRLLWWDSARIVVADDDMTLRAYDLQGRWLMVLGGRRQGPGRFRDPFPMSRTASWELAVWDGAPSRMRLFGACGRVVRSHNGTKVPDPESPLFLVRTLADGDRPVSISIPGRASSFCNPRSDWGISRRRVGGPRAGHKWHHAKHHQGGNFGAGEVHQDTGNP
jgi:hypothetical protein